MDLIDTVDSERVPFRHKLTINQPKKKQNQGYTIVGGECSCVCDIFALFLNVKKNIF